MQVVEIFKSIQGEGTLIGSPMVFIRLWGCNMACDTRYSWAPEFKNVTKREKYTAEQLTTYLIKTYPEVTWFNFTGGEPSLWDEEIQKIIPLMHEHSKKICIQTNGKVWKQSLFSNLDKICMDIKCPDSGEASDIKSIMNLREQDELKFVLESQTDFDYAKKILKTYSPHASIIIQPVLNENESFEKYYEKLRILITEFESIQTDKIRILPQLHQLLWRDQSGK